MDFVRDGRVQTWWWQAYVAYDKCPVNFVKTLPPATQGRLFFHFVIMVTVRDVNTCLVCVVQLSWHFVRGHSTVYSVETVVAKCSCIRFTTKSVPYVAIPTCRISPSHNNALKRSLFWNVQKCHRLTTAIAPDYKSRDGFMRDDFLHSVMLHDRSDIRCQNFFLVLLCVITECVWSLIVERLLLIPKWM